MNNNVSLEEYFNLKFNGIDDKFNALDKANILAYQSMEKRLNGMNEFRDTLKDQASRFITRVELEVYMEKFNSNIKSLELSRAMLEGKADQKSVIITAAISLIGLLIGIFSLVR